jgi:hypothetical protein
VLLRSIWNGNVRFALAHTVVEDDGRRMAAYVRPGHGYAHVGRDRDGRYLHRWVSVEPAVAATWSRTRVLWLIERGPAHSLGLFWHDGTDEFLGWYVQLQAPVRPSRFGLDTTDHALDVWVRPDGSWEWKDEADLAEAVELGVFDDAEAAAIRAEGERVAAAAPWPTGWEGWRPDPSAAIPSLPDGWDRV